MTTGDQAPRPAPTGAPGAGAPPRPAGGPGGFTPRPGGGSGGPRPGGQGGRPGAGGRGRRFYPPRRRVCAFCVEKKIVIDYKNVSMLRRYLTERARISPRRRSGTCARHQRILAEAIKRARLLALLPFTPDHMRATGWHG
ncbi:MAG: 30S ribosomal protein S18 [Chloroflexi bacterium]|nr:30S ribosomal protein S18 [Chloroflexota bacterium]